jgi:hypothetical protein
LRSASLVKIHITDQGFAVLLLKHLLEYVVIHLPICQQLLVTITPGPPRIVLAEDLIMLCRVAILYRDVMRWQICRNVALLLT